MKTMRFGGHERRGADEPGAAAQAEHVSPFGDPARGEPCELSLLGLSAHPNNTRSDPVIIRLFFPLLFC